MITNKAPGRFALAGGSEARTVVHTLALEWIFGDPSSNSERAADMWNLAVIIDVPELIDEVLRKELKRVSSSDVHTVDEWSEIVNQSAHF